MKDPPCPNEQLLCHHERLNTSSSDEQLHCHQELAGDSPCCELGLVMNRCDVDCVNTSVHKQSISADEADGTLRGIDADCVQFNLLDSSDNCDEILTQS